MRGRKLHAAVNWGWIDWVKWRWYEEGEMLWRVKREDMEVIWQGGGMNGRCIELRNSNQ